MSSGSVAPQYSTGSNPQLNPSPYLGSSPYPGSNPPYSGLNPAVPQYSTSSSGGFQLTGNPSSQLEGATLGGTNPSVAASVSPFPHQYGQPQQQQQQQESNQQRYQYLNQQQQVQQPQHHQQQQQEQQQQQLQQQHKQQQHVGSGAVAMQDANALWERIETLEADLRSARLEAARARAALEAQEHRCAGLVEDVRRLESDRALLKKQVDAFASQLHLTNSQLAQAQAALQAADEQSKAHSSKSGEQTASLRKAVEAAGIERDAAVLAKEDLASQVRVLKRRLQEAEEEQCKAEEASAALAAELRALQHSAEATVDRAGAAFAPDPDQLRVAEAARDAAKAELQDVRHELTGMRQQLIAERQRVAVASGSKEEVEKELATVQAKLQEALEAQERLKKNVKGEVRQEEEGNIRSAIEAEVRQKLEAEVREEAESEFRKKVEAEVRQDVEGKIRKELEAEVREKVKVEVREDLGGKSGGIAEDSKASSQGEVEEGVQVTSASDEARKEIEAAAVARTRQEAKEEARKEVREELRSELRQEIEKQVRGEVTEKIREEVRRQVEAEARSEAKDQSEVKAVQEVTEGASSSAAASAAAGPAKQTDGEGVGVRGREEVGSGVLAGKGEGEGKGNGVEGGGGSEGGDGSQAVVQFAEELVRLKEERERAEAERAQLKQQVEKLSASLAKKEKARLRLLSESS
ncbi:hypothetical protein CLOP_g22372 [Closterium sp. NIES-67]|nr:hypothetical protein CLOP_g22372 [Closterium sp. NIES-67]